eukprot:1156504-Pelagomonas_calceolata.AAC.6
MPAMLGEIPGGSPTPGAVLSRARGKGKVGGAVTPVLGPGLVAGVAAAGVAAMEEGPASGLWAVPWTAAAGPCAAEGVVIGGDPERWRPMRSWITNAFHHMHSGTRMQMHSLISMHCPKAFYASSEGPLDMPFG